MKEDRIRNGMRVAQGSKRGYVTKLYDNGCFSDLCHVMWDGFGKNMPHRVSSICAVKDENAKWGSFSFLDQSPRLAKVCICGAVESISPQMTPAELLRRTVDATLANRIKKLENELAKETK